MNYFFVRNKGVFTRVDINDILYIEGCSNYVKVVTSQQSYLCLVRMKTVEQTLPTETFVRIHKSYIVPVDKVTGFSKDTVFIDTISLPVGNLYQSRLQDHFFILEKETKPTCSSHFKDQPAINRQPFTWPLEAMLRD